MLDLHTTFHGTLLGVAIGDALGAPFEGQLLNDWLSLLQRQQELVPRQYTDNTHMTIGMAESLVAKGGFDGADMVTVWARQFAEKPWRGYGAGPPQIFRLIDRGMAWNHAGHIRTNLMNYQSNYDKYLPEYQPAYHYTLPLSPAHPHL